MTINEEITAVLKEHEDLIAVPGAPLGMPWLINAVVVLLRAELERRKQH